MARFLSFVCLTVAGVSLMAWPADRTAASSQDAPGGGTRTLDRLIGQIVSIDAPVHTMVVKADGSNTNTTVRLDAVLSVLKVAPGQRDLKSAERIDASQLSVGDRVSIRGRKDGEVLQATVVLLMTAGDIERQHAAELSDWQRRGSAGVIARLGPGDHEFSMSERAAEGTKTVTVHVPAATELKRYPANSVKYADAKPSSFDKLKPGDQVRVLGNPGTDGSVTAEKIISGAFRTVPAKIVTVAADGRELQLTNQQTKQPLRAVLLTDTVVHQIPPQMAQMMAQRVAGNGVPPGSPAGGSTQTQPPVGGAPRYGTMGDRADGAGGPPMRRTGDFTRIVERLPTIPASELKAGDSVLVYGGIDASGTQMTALKIISGVEPLLAANPRPQTRTQPGQGPDAGAWNLDLAIPNQ